MESKGVSREQLGLILQPCVSRPELREKNEASICLSTAGIDLGWIGTRRAGEHGWVL